MRGILPSLLLLLVAYQAHAVLVDAPAGKIKGKTVGDADMFLGIPFAEPPVNELRWRSPVEKAALSGVFDASHYAADCISDRDDYIKGKTSEDCLYLNVFRPTNVKPDEKLPVMVWIYGGSFQHGGSSYITYHAESLATFGRVVVVSMNYRVGIMGFFGAKAFAEEATHGSTGNFGLQDQRLAMVWVQKNIAHFNGDPETVTIFGQSAGGGSVSSHLVLPRSKGLFKRAIIESGPPADWGMTALDDADAVAKIAGQHVGCPDEQDSKAWTACMRQVNATDLVKLNNGIVVANRSAWSPVQDGVEFVQSTQTLWATGKLNPVDAILLGTVEDEGTEFTFLPANADALQFDAYMNSSFVGATFRADVKALYSLANFSYPFFDMERVVTHYAMSCPSRRGARWAAQAAGGAAVYTYLWAHQYSVFRKEYPSWRVGHSSEVAFVFHDYALLLDKDEPALADTTAQYWTNFAATGDPNKAGANNPGGAAGLVNWPRYNAKNGSHLVLNLTSYAAADYGPAVYCDFWDTIFSKGCNVADFPVVCDY